MGKKKDKKDKEKKKQQRKDQSRPCWSDVPQCSEGCCREDTARC